MALEIGNGAEEKRKDLGYVLKVSLMILVWMLRLRRHKEKKKKKDNS